MPKYRVRLRQMRYYEGFIESIEAASVPELAIRLSREVGTLAEDIHDWYREEPLDELYVSEIDLLNDYGDVVETYEG